MTENKENQNKKLWFRRKRYGWGWFPITIEGWLVLFAYLFIIIFIVRAADVNRESGTFVNFIPLVLATTFLLLVVCIYKGEKPKWSWGDKK